MGKPGDATALPPGRRRWSRVRVILAVLGLATAIAGLIFVLRLYPWVELPDESEPTIEQRWQRVIEVAEDAPARSDVQSLAHAASAAKASEHVGPTKGDEVPFVGPDLLEDDEREAIAQLVQWHRSDAGLAVVGCAADESAASFERYRPRGREAHRALARHAVCMERLLEGDGLAIHKRSSVLPKIPWPPWGIVWMHRERLVVKKLYADWLLETLPYRDDVVRVADALQHVEQPQSATLAILSPRVTATRFRHLAEDLSAYERLVPRR